MKTIIFANIAEAFEDAINKVNSEKQKTERIQIEHNLCDRTLLWEGDEKIVVTPFPISRVIWEKNKQILNLKNVVNLSPSKIDVSLVDAVMKDRKLLKELIRIIKENPGIELSPYCVTQKFLLLVNYLKTQGLKFSVNEKPENCSEWTVSFLYSKVGSRAEISKIKDNCIKVPESFACKTEEDAIEIAKWFYTQKRSCVLKANFGESGWGLLILKREDFENDQSLANHIRKEFKKDEIWQKELLLVEEYIKPNAKFSSGSPSSELFISDKGAQITYLCDQVLGVEGDFLGVALGKGVIEKNMAVKLKKISLLIGKKYWQLGYRGFFDIDFVLSGDNTPYIIETNTRRTGGTHVYDVARKVFGKNWEVSAFVLSQDNFQYGKRKLKEKEIMDKLEDIMYPIRGRKEGLILSIINKWQPTLGFIIVSNSKQGGLEIHSKLLKKFGIKN